MKKRFIPVFLLPLLFLTASIKAQQGEWVWVKGDTIQFAPGNFGVMGVPSPTNEPPGRYACSHWTDTSGNLWIYGGLTPGGGSMWKFDPVTTEWTWMAGPQSPGDTLRIAAGTGIYNALNNPGNLIIQGMCTWVTRNNNHLWLMGSTNLWQYDPSINQWACMGAIGPKNYGTMGVGTATTLPGSRVETSNSWADCSGNLWLFGGQAGGQLNDMWQYNVSNGIWTWMSGTNLINNLGTYGTLGVPSVNNVPPSRCTNMAWSDNEGNFWLAGGENISTSSYYQDVWKFNPQTLEWTWVDGLSGPDASGPSGTNCDTLSTNKEGKRWENRGVWKVCDELVINYSGSPTGSYAVSVNDLWAFLPSSNQWVLINSAGAQGIYGSQGVATASNFPPARVGAVGAVDKQRNLWMFGGTTVRGNWYNDLWKYTLDSSCVAAAYCSTGINCPEIVGTPLQTNATGINGTCADTCGGSATATVSSGTPPYHYLWNPGNDTTASIANLCAGNYSVTITDSLGNSATNSVNISSPSPPQVIAAANKQVFCPTDSALICATSGLISYQWNTGANDSCIYTNQAGNYYVTVTDSNGCTATSNHVAVSVLSSPPVAITVSGDTLSVVGAITCQWYRNDSLIAGATNLVYIARQPGNYTVLVTDSNGCSTLSNPVLPTGIENIESAKFVVYPNPFGNAGFMIEVGSRMIGASLQIFDAGGRLVYQTIIKSPVSQILPDAASGVYVLKLNYPGFNAVKKLVKL